MGENRLKRDRWKGFIVFAMISIALMVLLGRRTGEKPVFLSYPEFWEMAESGQVKSLKWSNGETWEAELQDGTRIQTPNPRAEDGKERLLSLGIDVREQEDFSPLLLLGALGVPAALFLIRGTGRGAVGLPKYAAVQADERVPSVTFDDVAASGETLTGMRDLVDFLEAPQKFLDYGARPPKGVMLYGPPGTGKTLLARALAGEAKTPFFAMSGADFVQVYVGVGASRVRELFRKARKAGGGVIFIDEIDAIGKRRDSGTEEREQALNALLTEMSGFSGADGIIVLAATNRLDTLDPALLREGRFDRRIEVSLPDYEQRLKILKVHAKNKPLDEKISMEKWAAQTAMFSGAQLETMLNEAAIRAARRNEGRILDTDLEAAFCAVTAGEERPMQISESEKRITAWHEAGHALITRKMLPENRITKVTVIPSSRGAAGYSMSIPPDRLLHTRKELMAMICAALGGRAAEEMLLGRDSVTTGAANDLKKAREFASAMAGDFAMGDTGNREQDEKAILEKALEDTRKCLRENKDLLIALAQALMEKETLREEEIAALIG